MRNLNSRLPEDEATYSVKGRVTVLEVKVCCPEYKV